MLNKTNKIITIKITIIINKKIKSEWKELAWLDLGFFLPLSCIVYSVVPLESRVTVMGVASVVYTVFVSLWNEQKSKSDDTFMTNILSKVNINK